METNCFGPWANNKTPAEGFLVENVTGLLNMERGEVLKTIKQVGSVSYNVAHWVLKAEEYGVPQRRTRFFVGIRDGNPQVLHQL